MENKNVFAEITEIAELDRTPVDYSTPDFGEDKSEVQDSKSTKSFMVDYRNIVVEDGFNSREDYGTEQEMKALEDSILSLLETHKAGLLKPLEGFNRDGKSVLTDGHRRYLAICRINKRALEETGEAKIKMVPFDVTSRNMADRSLQVLATGHDPFKKRLNAVELARSIKAALNAGNSKQKISAASGLSLAMIDRYVALNDAPIQLQNILNSGQISTTTATNIVLEAKGDHKTIMAKVEEIQSLIAKAEVEAKDVKTETLDNTEKLDTKVAAKKPVKIKASALTATHHSIFKKQFDDLMKQGAGCPALETLINLLAETPKKLSSDKGSQAELKNAMDIIYNALTKNK